MDLCQFYEKSLYLLQPAPWMKGQDEQRPWKAVKSPPEWDDGGEQTPWVAAGPRGAGAWGPEGAGASGFQGGQGT